MFDISKVRRTRIESRNFRSVYFLVMLSAVLAGCAKTNIHAPKETRLPPGFKVSSYSQVMVAPIDVHPDYKSDAENVRAIKRIQEVFNQELAVRASFIENIHAAESVDAARGLVIVPVVEKIKYVNGEKRFASGPSAGSSAVLLKVTFYEYPAKKIVHETHIYHNSMEYGGIFALAGATGGAADNRMLSDTGRDLASFLADCK